MLTLKADWGNRPPFANLRIMIAKRENILFEMKVEEGQNSSYQNHLGFKEGTLNATKTGNERTGKSFFLY